MAIGLGLLLFVAYQLWGTGLLESHAQSALRRTLEREVPARADAALRRVLARPDHRGPGRNGPRRPATAPPAAAPPAAAPPAGRPVGLLLIPALGVDQVVVEGVGPADLELGPGHYPGTPLPGEYGNAAIAGHRTTWGHPFFDLDALAAGDRIVVMTEAGIFVYVARRTAVVDPGDVAVLDPTARPELTLTTCNPRYSAAQRLVVVATLSASQLFGRAHGHGPVGPARGRRADRPAPSPGVPATPGVALTMLAGVLAAAFSLAARFAPGRGPVRSALRLGGAAAALVALWYCFGGLSTLVPQGL